MADNSRIFRQVALERLSTPEQLDQMMRITSPLGWLLLFAVLLVISASLTLSVIAKVPVKVPASGMLINPGGVLAIVSENQGRIKKLYVRPGDLVEIGQVVADLEQPEIRQELELAQSELNQLNNQKKLVVEFQERDSKAQLAFLSQRKKDISLGLKHARERIEWLKEREKSEEELWNKQFISKQKYLDTKIEIKAALENLAKAQNELNQVEREETSLSIGKERELLDKEMAISSLVRKIEGLNDRLKRQSVVLSPYAGAVVEAKVNPGELVDKSTPLFNIIPASESKDKSQLIAVLYAPSGEGKKVRSGMEVQIAPTTVKKEEYGFILGRVKKVSEIPSTSEGMMRILKNQQIVQSLSANGAPFEVMVELEIDPQGRILWSSSNGPEQEINNGTLADAMITVREIRLISLLIPAFEQWLH